MKTKDQLYAEDVLKCFKPKNPEDKIVKYEEFDINSYSSVIIDAVIARAKKNGVI
jgi:hypothetical protein